MNFGKEIKSTHFWCRYRWFRLFLRCILGEKIKRWLKIVFGAILGDSGYFWVFKKKVPPASSSARWKYFSEMVNSLERKHVMLAAIFSAISDISADFSFKQKWFFHNEIYFSRIVNEIIEIARIILSILWKRWILGGK